MMQMGCKSYLEALNSFYHDKEPAIETKNANDLKVESKENVDVQDESRILDSLLDRSKCGDLTKIVIILKDDIFDLDWHFCVLYQTEKYLSWFDRYYDKIINDTKITTIIFQIEIGMIDKRKTKKKIDWEIRKLKFTQQHQQDKMMNQVLTPAGKVFRMLVQKINGKLKNDNDLYPFSVKKVWNLPKKS